MFFASDNGAPVPDAIMAALAEANRGPALPYGAEPAMAALRDRLRAVFEAPEAAVHLVATGTAANALALSVLCPPWGAAYCHPLAHIEGDECGAPEFYTGGAKLVHVPGEHGLMAPGALAATLRGAASVGVHNVQPGALSLTNVTECGTVYTPDRIAELADIARARGLPCHLDGARFANALVAAGCTPAEMTWKAGVDILCLGATKNGCLGVEAVILFDPAKAWEFELRRKRAGHLFSKHRYLTAQMAAWLEGDLWLRLAAHANRMAARLSAGLGRLGEVRLDHPTDANIVFATIPSAAHARAEAAGAVYYAWPADPDAAGPGDPLGVRLVCSWATTEAEVDGLVAAFAG